MNGNVATGNEGWEVGNRVAHRKDLNRYGVIAVVEDNKLSVMVQWNDMPEGELDFQWANKLVPMFKRVGKNEDKPHRCPQCHEIPDEAYLDGTTIAGKLYECNQCLVEWVA